MKIIFKGEIAEIIKDIIEDFDNGRLEGLMLIKKIRKGMDGEVWTTYSGMSYLERLGALEVLRDDFKIEANQSHD